MCEKSAWSPWTVLVCLLAALVAAGCAPKPGPRSLVPNGSFDEGMTQWHAGHSSKGKKEDVEVAIDRAGLLGGKKALRVTSRNDDAVNLANSSSFPLVGDLRYVLSFAYRFVAIIEPYRGEPLVKSAQYVSVTPQDETAVGLKVAKAGRIDHILSANNGHKPVTRTLRDGQRTLVTDAEFAVASYAGEELRCLSPCASPYERPLPERASRNLVHYLKMGRKHGRYC